MICDKDLKSPLLGLVFISSNGIGEQRVPHQMSIRPWP